MLNFAGFYKGLEPLASLYSYSSIGIEILVKTYSLISFKIRTPNIIFFYSGFITKQRWSTVLALLVLVWILRNVHKLKRFWLQPKIH